MGILKSRGINNEEARIFPLHSSIADDAIARLTTDNAEAETTPELRLPATLVCGKIAIWVRLIYFSFLKTVGILIISWMPS